MCIFEPIWWCLNDMYGDFAHAGLFTSYCPAGIVWKERAGKILAEQASHFAWLSFVQASSNCCMVWLLWSDCTWAALAAAWSHESSTSDRSVKESIPDLQAALRRKPYGSSFNLLRCFLPGGT